MPETNLTQTLIKAQSIDFVEQFGNQITTLLQLLGIGRKIPMAAGTTLKTYKSSVTLDGTTVEKGAVIPLSEVKLEEGDPIELEFDKKRKAVAVEDIQKYGFERAVAITDQKLIRELQKELRGKMFAQLATGTGAVSGVGLQGAIAQAWGGVQVAFEDEGVDTIVFVNPLDVADYLAKTNITVQTAFGLSYVENFLGARVAIISSTVPAKTVYGTAPENLVFAYATVAAGEINKAFDFTVEETGIIGVLHDINHQRLTSETVTLSAIALFAERLDGVIKATITPSV